MMDLQKFKQKYPQYKDVDEDKLANALHQKYYKDKVKYSDFRDVIGLSPEVISPAEPKTFWDKTKETAGDMFRGPEPGVGPVSEKDFEAFEPDNPPDIDMDFGKEKPGRKKSKQDTGIVPELRGRQQAIESREAAQQEQSEQTQLRPAEPTSMLGDAINKIKKSVRMSPAKSSNVIALAKEQGIPPHQALKYYDELTEGFKTQPDPMELYTGLLTYPIVAGLMSNPVGVLTGIGTFMAVDEAENYIVSKIKNEDYQPLGSKGLKELAPDNLNEQAQTALELLDFIGKGAVAGKIGKTAGQVAGKWWNKLTNRERGLQTVKINEEMRQENMSLGEAIRQRVRRAKEEGRYEDEMSQYINKYVRGQKKPKPTAKTEPAAKPSESSEVKTLDYVKKLTEPEARAKFDKAIPMPPKEQPPGAEPIEMQGPKQEEPAQARKTPEQPQAYEFDGKQIAAQIEGRLANKYRNLYNKPGSRLPHVDYQSIVDLKRKPETLDKKIANAENKENYIRQTEAAIADILGTLNETYRYESVGEGQEIEAYVDSLLEVTEKHKVPGETLPDKDAGAQIDQEPEGLSPNRRVGGGDSKPEPVSEVQAKDTDDEATKKIAQQAQNAWDRMQKAKAEADRGGALYKILTGGKGSTALKGRTKKQALKEDLGYNDAQADSMVKTKNPKGIVSQSRKEYKDAKDFYESKKKQLEDARGQTEPSDVEISGGKNKTAKVDIPKQEAETLKPKEQKAYLLEEIEAAIEKAPDTAAPILNKQDIEMAGIRDWPTHQQLLEQQKAEHGTITIKVPGDGEFTVLNNKTALRNFQKKAKSFPVSELKSKTSTLPSTKPLNKRITGFMGEYSMPYKRRKPPKLIERPKHQREAGYYGDGFYSTGNFAVKMQKPKTKRPLADFPGPGMKQFFDRDMNELVPATIGNEVYTDPTGDAGLPQVTVSGPSTEYDYNPTHMDFILSKHPDSKILMDQETGTLFHYDKNDNLVGLQRPYEDSKRPIDIGRPGGRAKESPMSADAVSGTGGPVPSDKFYKIPQGQRRSSLIKEASKKLEVPIRTGKFKIKRGNMSAAGIYKQDPEVIRLAKANDVETAIHEIGHHVEKLLGLPKRMPKEVRDMAYEGADNLSREGFAEFLRYYVTQPEVAKNGAPKFYDQFEQKLDEHPDIQDVIIKAKNAWNVWQESPSISKVHSFIQHGGKGKSMPTLSEVYTNLKDSLYPIQQVVKTAEKKGYVFQQSDNPYVMARLTRGWARKAEQYLKYGTYQYDPQQGMKITGKSLQEILKPVENDGNLELLDTYLIAKRAANDPRILKGFGGILSKQDFEQTIRELEPKFKKTADELYNYSNELLNFLVDSGRIGSEAANAMRENNLFYAPMYRVMDYEAPMGGLSSKRFSSVINPIKKLKGSSRDIYSPTESLLYNTVVSINAAERNRVGKAFMRLADKPGMGEVIEKIPAPMKPVKMTKAEAIKNLTKDLDPIEKEMWEQAFEQYPPEALEEMAVAFRPDYTPKPNEALFYENGKPVLYEISPDLAKALGNISAEDVGMLARIASYPARWLRAGATTFSPGFAVRNPFRDQMTAFLQSEYGFVPAFDFLRGIYNMAGKTEMWQRFNASGAAHSAIVSIDREYLAKNLKELFEQGNFKGYVKNPLKMMQVLSEYTEEATRVGEVIRAQKKEGQDYESLLKSGMAGSEVSLDYRRQGEATARALNLISAFWNARLEGLDKMGRTFRDHPVRASIKSFLGITVPTLLLWYAQKDDPYYQELPTWRRVGCWNIVTHNEDGSLKHIWSIPRPFSYGILFGAIPETALDYMYNEDPAMVEETMKKIGETLNLAPTPTVAVPIIEWIANKNLYFDRPLVPRGKEELEPPLQYRGYTSETIKLAAKIMDKVPGLKKIASPAKIENLILGYTAAAGRLGLQAGDELIKSLGIIDTPPEPKMTLNDIPGIKSFTSRFPSSNTRSIETFYKKYYDMRTKWESTKERAGVRGKNLTVGSPAKLKEYRKSAKALSVLRKMASEIYESETVDPETKKETLDNIYFAMMNVARAALNKDLIRQQNNKLEKEP